MPNIPNICDIPNIPDISGILDITDILEIPDIPDNILHNEVKFSDFLNSNFWYPKIGVKNRTF